MEEKDEQQPSSAKEISEETSEHNPQEIQEFQHRSWLMLEFEFWLFHIIVMCLCIYLISQVVNVNNQILQVLNSEEHRYALETIELWKKGYIVDIRQVKSDNCPEGFEELIKYEWPGTIEGCYCHASINSYTTDYIMQGACSSELINLGCKTLQPINAMNIKMWKGNKLLCYKRVNSLTFYNSTLDKLEGVGSMKSCGLNQSYLVKTLPELNCPITQISNITISNTLNPTKVELDTLNSHNLYTYLQQGYPIADFKLTEYKFCPYLDEINISPQKQGNYILEAVNYSIPCSSDVQNPLVKEFDYLTEESYITNNTRLYDMIKTLPGYPRPSSAYAFRLGFVRYPAWTDSCRRSETHNLVEATRHLTFGKVHDIVQIVMKVCLVFLCLVGFAWRGFYIFRHIMELKAKNQYNMMVLTDREIGEQIPNINTLKSYKKELINFTIELIFLIIIIIILCICEYWLVFESEWIKYVFSSKCTEEHIYSIFKFYEKYVDHCVFIGGRSIMFLFVIIVFVIAHIFIRRQYGDLMEAFVLTPEFTLSNEELLKGDLDEKVIGSNLNMDEMHEDSSNIILAKSKTINNGEEDQFDDGDIEGGARETGLNFYGNQPVEPPNFHIIKKKKKKKGFKHREFFKDN